MLLGSRPRWDLGNRFEDGVRKNRPFIFRSHLALFESESFDAVVTVALTFETVFRILVAGGLCPSRHLGILGADVFISL